jgi:hypothetical protein
LKEPELTSPPEEKLQFCNYQCIHIPTSTRGHACGSPSPVFVDIIDTRSLLCTRLRRRNCRTLKKKGKSYSGNNHTTSNTVTIGLLAKMLKSLTDKPPAGLRWRSHTLFVTTTVGMGAFTDLFLYGLIVPVLPFLLKDRVNISESQIQGTISMLLAVYAAASCVTSPIAGVLADKFASSRQLPFTMSLLMLVAATVMFAFGESVAVLVIARFLQGASGGEHFTSSMLCRY